MLPQRGWFRGSANRDAVVAHVEVSTDVRSDDNFVVFCLFDVVRPLPGYRVPEVFQTFFFFEAVTSIQNQASNGCDFPAGRK